MRPEAYQLFAQLCEGFVTEASTAIATFRSQPGGQAVARALHKELSLPHDLEYKQITKISWSELKDASAGSWVLLVGDNGSGAIRYNNGSYRALASTGNEPKMFTNDRGGNILDFLKQNIGQLRKFYVSFPSNEYQKGFNLKTREREKLRRDANAGPMAVSQEDIVKKFKPLWNRALVAAIADIKGMVANMIKNDSFEKAQKKLSRLTEMNKAMDDIEAGNLDTAPELVANAVSLAISMAASHYYPDKTGDISRSYRGYSVANREGTRQLLSDISNGDQAKLGAVLAFFKRNLISG